MEKNLLRKGKIFSLFLVKFLIIGFFANSLLVQACFCGEACLHGIQGKAKTRPSFLFHNRCPGAQCKSCDFEDVQTLKASNIAHPTAKLKTFNTPFISFHFADCRFNVNFIKIFFSRLHKYVNVQSPPTYLQNLSLHL